MKLDIFSPLLLNITKVERIKSRNEIIIAKCKDKDVLHIGYTDWTKTVLKKIRIFPLYLLFIAVPFFGLSVVMIAQKKVANNNINKFIILK